MNTHQHVERVLWRAIRFFTGKVEPIDLELYMGAGGFAVGWLPVGFPACVPS